MPPVLFWAVTAVIFAVLAAAFMNLGLLWAVAGCSITGTSATAMAIQARSRD